MYKASAYLLLPLMWINLTVSENNWTVFGLRPDVLIHGMTILFAWYVGLLTRYRVLVSGMLALAGIMRLIDALGAGASLSLLAWVPLSVIFAVAGASIYGRTPEFLHKQLVIFLAMCVPIMIMQVLGVSPLLMVWDTSFLDDPLSNFTADDVGTFKNMSLYPTLFVGTTDLHYVIGQGRPAGLMHNNNILSVFVSIAIAVNLAIARTSRLRLSDVVVTAAAALTMSKQVFGIAIILYLGFLFFGSAQRRLLALKLIMALAIALVLYYFFFPGLFLLSTSEGVALISIIPRLADLVNALGAEEVFSQIILMGDTFRPGTAYTIGENYTTYATLIRSQVAIPVFIAMAIGLVLYAYRVRRMVPRPAMVYALTLFTLVISQFGVPFYRASAFHLILGFALFPLFRKLRFRGGTTNMGAQVLSEQGRAH